MPPLMPIFSLPAFDFCRCIADADFLCYFLPPLFYFHYAYAADISGLMR